VCKRGDALSLPVLIARVSLIVSHHQYPAVISSQQSAISNQKRMTF
jgi:hypothetical protein